MTDEDALKRDNETKESINTQMDALATVYLTENPSLRLLSMATIIRDSNYEELRQIALMARTELFNRSHDVTVVLYNQNANVLKDLGYDIYNMVIFMGITDYISHNSKYTHLKDEEIRLIATKVMYRVDTMYNTLASYITSPFHTNEMAINNIEFEELIRVLLYDDITEPNIQESMISYYTWLDADNPWIINAVKKLHKSGTITPGIILYTFRLPNDKRYQIHSSERLGTYPVIVD